MFSYDIVIVGGGIVGLTQALALKNSGLSIAVIEPNPSQGLPTGDAQLRVSALTLATENILHNIGAWQHLDATRLTSYQQMFVWDQDSFGKIAFAAREVKQPQLGYIVENQHVRHALWTEAQQSQNITMLATKIAKLTIGQQECFINLQDNQAVTAKLVIGADGANSAVKKFANFAQTFWDYDQHAIVATIKITEPHQNTARQVFTPTGPLAFLPLWDEYQCSVVWSQDEPTAAKLLALPADEFNKAITAAIDAKLGLCELHSTRQSFPLTMRYARQWVSDRVAIIGDAAHTIHPLAGQGANLGILDAAALAQQIIRLANQDKDFGLAKNLRPFERWRKTEAVKMAATMEGFKRLFADNYPLKKLLRDTGLSLANRSTLAKQKIIQHAMGLSGELPELAKNQNTVN
jgi:2-octaprenylphenol hydroxylase